MKNFRLQLAELIRNDQIDLAFQDTARYLGQGHPLFNDFTLLQNRWTSLKQEKLRGVLPEEEFARNKNSILHTLQNIIGIKEKKKRDRPVFISIILSVVLLFAIAYVFRSEMTSPKYACSCISESEACEKTNNELQLQVVNRYRNSISLYESYIVGSFSDETSLLLNIQENIRAFALKSVDLEKASPKCLRSVMYVNGTALCGSYQLLASIYERRAQKAGTLVDTSLIISNAGQSIFYVKKALQCLNQVNTDVSSECQSEINTWLARQNNINRYNACLLYGMALDYRFNKNSEFTVSEIQHQFNAIDKEFLKMYGYNDFNSYPAIGWLIDRKVIPTF